MKRLGGIWERVVSFDNLLLAFHKARRGKRRRPAVAGFERKPRLIAAAPFRDRVVHHALLNIVEPVIDRRFIFDSYACRAGKGTHAAVARYQDWSRRHAYALKLDIAGYFPSIDRDLLKAKLRGYVKDARVLDLFDRIIDASPPAPNHLPLVYFPGDDLFTPLERHVGIPIGNLTSQFLANLYLDDFDHFVKDTLRVGAYLRYVDDTVLLDNDKGRLADLRQCIAERLQAERLRLHPNNAHIVPTRYGLDLLGYRVYPDRRRLRNDNGWRFARKLRRFADGYAQGRLRWADIDPAVQSWIGHARHADTEGLRQRLFSEIVFRRGAGQTAPSA